MRLSFSLLAALLSASVVTADDKQPQPMYSGRGLKVRFDLPKGYEVEEQEVEAEGGKKEVRLRIKAGKEEVATIRQIPMPEKSARAEAERMGRFAKALYGKANVTPYEECEFYVYKTSGHGFRYTHQGLSRGVILADFKRDKLRFELTWSVPMKGAKDVMGDLENIACSACPTK